MRVAIISDTHVPSRADGIPGWVREAVRDADHTVHAGDFDSVEAYEAVRELAGDGLTAVRGNLDPTDIDLPDHTSVDLGGVTFAVTHGTGPAQNYAERVLETVRREVGEREGVVGVSGHTHEVLDVETDGVRLLNPGSATGVDPATEATMMVASVADGDLSVEVRRA